MKKNKETVLDKFDMSNKVCVITGGAGFLAKSHAEALLEANGTVILTDIDENKLKEMVSTLNKEYPKKVFGYVSDITKEDSVKSFVQLVIKKHKKISVLINNAASSSHHVTPSGLALSRLENFPLKAWEQDIAVGLTGAFLLSKDIGNHMSKNGGGVILNIASDLGLISPDQRLYRKEGLKEDEQPAKPVSYTVIKHALIGLTKYLATYWPDKGVRAVTLSPASVFNNQPEEFLERINKLIPLGRMSRRDEFKAAVLFLCSDASSYMTGSNLIVDGGRTTW